jgi:hypothetical protein
METRVALVLVFVAAAALEHANLPDFNENWLELSAKAGLTDFAFITRKG